MDQPVPKDQPGRRGGQRGPRCGDFGGHNKRGLPCGQPAIAGTERCVNHAGKPLARAKAEGNVVVEVRRWGLADKTVDPGEVLLRLVTQSAARVELYSRLLEEAYDAAGRLQQAFDADAILLDAPEPRVRYGPEGEEIEMPEHAARQTARQDLRRIFMTGPVAALIGHTYTSTKDGDVFATGEAIRGLTKLEADERDRCANFAAKAVAAGLAERQVRVAEDKGRQMAGAVRYLLEALGLTPEQWARVPGLLQQAVNSITGKPIIEGEAA